MDEIVLAGDVGGTKTLLAYFRIGRRGITLLKKKRFENKDFENIEEVVEEFLRWPGLRAKTAASVFGVAAPVEDGFSQLTNLNWTIDAKRLKKRSGIKNLRLINDMVATAWGLALLKKKDYLVLNRGSETGGNRALIAPGTGLGEGIIFSDGRYFIPFPSEGGHADFAPKNPVEMGLFSYLMDRFGHVSYERVVSGPGLKNIYDFLTSAGRRSMRIEKRFRKEPPPSVITGEAKKAGGDAACREALEIFVSILGSEAGNLALKAFATGGVYIGGGIVPAITKTLKSRVFMEAFLGKGRFGGLLSRIPVKVVLNSEIALLGSANCAMHMVKGEGCGF